MLFSYAPTFLRTYAPTHLRTYAPTYAPILCAAPAHSRRNGTQRFELVIGGVGDVRGKASITRALRGTRNVNPALGSPQHSTQHRHRHTLGDRVIAAV